MIGETWRSLLLALALLLAGCHWLLPFGSSKKAGGDTNALDHWQEVTVDRRSTERWPDGPRRDAECTKEVFCGFEPGEGGCPLRNAQGWVSGSYAGSTWLVADNANATFDLPLCGAPPTWQAKLDMYLTPGTPSCSLIVLLNGQQQIAFRVEANAPFADAGGPWVKVSIDGVAIGTNFCPMPQTASFQRASNPDSLTFTFCGRSSSLEVVPLVNSLTVTASDTCVRLDNLYLKAP